MGLLMLISTFYIVLGKYICEGDGISSAKTPTPPVGSAGSPNSYIRTG